MTDSVRVRVACKELIAEGICAFQLTPEDAGQLPAFAAGAHIDVTTSSGLVRQYSLCNQPTDRSHYRIAVLREDAGRGGSKAMHDSLSEGDVLDISRPRNHFALEASDAPCVLLAGGIGITPILAMAYELEAAGREFALHYCTRSAARTAFREEVAKHFASKAHVYHDDGSDEKRFSLAQVIEQAPPEAHLYVCGPAGFIEAVLAQAKSAGWTEQRLHREFFSAAPVKTAGDGAFEVVLASTGNVVRVAPDQTVVGALAAAGIEVQTSCEQGVCGTCVTRILDGVPEHRDCYFTDEERAKNDQFTPCCSRAKTSRLVLDI